MAKPLTLTPMALFDGQKCYLLIKDLIIYQGKSDGAGAHDLRGIVKGSWVWSL